MADTTLQDIFAVSGTVWCVSANSANSPSDSNAGTSWTAPFATVHHAISVAGAYDLILVGPGTFAEGNNTLNLPSGCSLYGSGIYATTITSSYETGAIVCPGTGSVVQDMTIQGVAASGNYQYPLGALTNAGQTIASNAIARRLRLIGDTDGFILSCNTTSPPTCQWDLYDIDFSTKWDALNASNTHSGNPWPGLVINLYGPRSNVLGPSGLSAGAPTSRGLLLAAANGGILNIFGIGPSGRRGTSYTNNTDSSGAQQVSALYAGNGATINAYDMTLGVNLNATMQGSAIPLDAQTTGSGKINLYDSVGSGPGGAPVVGAGVNVLTTAYGAMRALLPSMAGGGAVGG